MTRLQRFAFTLAAFLPLSPAAANMSQSILAGTAWETAAISAPCRLDPYLLYSVAIVESRYSAGKNMIRPHPYALRNGPSGSAYPNTVEEARTLLGRYIEEDRLTDIGAMQINLRWNGHRVPDPADLLDLHTNVKVGAEILCESLAAYPQNLALGIGGYHTRNPERRNDAITYGENVLYIWRHISKGNK